MKICVVLILALYSAIISAESKWGGNYPNETYEMYRGKCVASSPYQRHPAQLLRNHRGCLYQQSKTENVIMIQCDGWKKQIIQYTSTNCKA